MPVLEIYGFMYCKLKIYIEVISFFFNKENNLKLYAPCIILQYVYKTTSCTN